MIEARALLSPHPPPPPRSAWYGASPAALCCCARAASRLSFTPTLPRLQSFRLRWLDSSPRWCVDQNERGKIRAFVDGGSSRGGWQVALLEPLEGNSLLSVNVQDICVTLLVAVGAFAWIRLFDFLSSRNFVEQKLSRKLVHISSGLLYALCWPFFSKSDSARYLAALVPLANGVRLLIYGLGIGKSGALVKSMTRKGDPKELLRGPLYYVIALFLITVVFWRDSPVGVLALSMMCGGDGIADIVGSNYGLQKLPHNKDKSWAGSIAMLIFGYAVSLGILLYFSSLGLFKYDLVDSVTGLLWISLAATFVESLPITSKVDDNIIIPVTTILLGLVIFT